MATSTLVPGEVREERGEAGQMKNKKNHTHFEYKIQDLEMDFLVKKVTVSGNTKLFRMQPLTVTT